MESAFSLDKVFYEQINEKMTSLGYKYIRKYKMFMKVTGNMLLKYLYIERFSMINRGIFRFMISGNVRSVYADSFEKKSLVVETLRNCTYYDIKAGFENNYPKEYKCSVDDVEHVINQAFEDVEKGILKEIDSVDSFEKYIRFCQVYNYGQICSASEHWKDSLSLIVEGDHNDMYDTLEMTVKAFEKVDGKESAERQYPLFHRAIVELVAGERDKVYNDPKLYKAAMEEAERRKETNTQTLMTLKLI